MMVPNKPMGFPATNDHDLGCEMGVALFLETPMLIFEGWINPRRCGLNLQKFHHFQEAHRFLQFLTFSTSTDDLVPNQRNPLPTKQPRRKQEKVE